MYQHLRSFMSLSVGALCACLIMSSCHSSSQSDNAGTDSAGFVRIFNGTTLDGWAGDTAVWKVEDGAITGEVTAASTPLKSNTFLIWQGGLPSDFELTGEYMISSGGNSGIQYRSEEVPGVPYGLRGYQFDIDGANQYTGQNYEERKRCIIAFRGQKVTLPAVSAPIDSLAKHNVWTATVVTDSLGRADSLKALIHNGWNQFRLVIKGNHLQHYINGVLVCDVTDDDTTNRKSSGLIGMQVHAGHIMKVAYRNLLLKQE